MTFPCLVTGEDSWLCYQPDGRADVTKVLSGVGEVPTHSCQYWVNGVPAICSNWNKDTKKCEFKFGTTDEGEETDIPPPTGYNGSECDGLGRKSWCDQYTSTTTEGSDYICIAPCMERSGLGTQASGVDSPFLVRVKPDDIIGYNEEEGVGLCDGHGLGRGADNHGKSVEDLKKEPVNCNYYRPYSMGFGSLQPQEYINDSAGGIFIEEMIAQATADRQSRLPYHFKVYNLRARAQKCAYWDQDYGTNFTLNELGQIILTGEPFTGNKVSYCVCPDSASNPYKTRNLDSTKVRPLLRRVWSEEANAVICNGAKPECPCYTGEWLYNVDEKMLPGMRIEAEQILELRFWIHNWPDQETYERYFERIPGNHKDDPTTADIYTFSSWKKISYVDPGESIMAGKKIRLCFPTSPVGRTFDKDLYMKIDPVTFPKAYFKRGTSAENQVSYPTLVRDLEEFEPIPLEITYPYYYKNPYDLNFGCDIPTADVPPCIKRSNLITGDAISIVGNTVRNKTIITVNMSATTATFAGFNNYKSSFLVSEEHKPVFYNGIRKFIEQVREEDYLGEVLYEDTSDNYGVFNAGPVKLKLGLLNRVVVIVVLNNIELEFRTIDVWSQWHGGIVTQTEFEKSYPNNEPGYVDGEDAFLSPAGIVKLEAYPLKSGNKYDCKTRVLETMPFYKREALTLYDLKYEFNYTIKKITSTGQYSTKWIRVGNSGVLWIEIDDNNLNYIMDWGVDNILVTNPANTSKKTPEEPIEYEVVLPNNNHKRTNIPRNVVVIKPKNNKLIWVDKDATVKFDYWYEKIYNDNSTGEGVELVIPAAGDDTSRFSVSRMSIKEETNEEFKATYSISNIISETAAIMTLFVDEEETLVSTVATKLLVDIPRIKCRSVDAFYKWTTQVKRYQLEPSRGFVTDTQPNSFVGVETKFRVPPCGDHELQGLSDTGPMWYPFNGCSTYEFYDVATVTNYCTLAHEGIHRNDYRACGPDKNFVYVPGNAGSSNCVLKFFYHLAITADNQPSFCGWARISPWVNPVYYEQETWRLPPFGNTSRESVERFLSQEYITYISKIGGRPKLEHAWMPMVPDKDSFEITFNSLDTEGDGSVYTHSDPIYINQMNFVLAGYLAETFEDDRYRFEEVLNNRIERRVAYPPPLKEDHRGAFYAMYNFVHDDTAWVWREFWKSIERGRNDSERLRFVNVESPDYMYDMYKKEHRFIADEGFYDLTFEPPRVDEEGGLTNYPSIRLGNGPRRYFEIIYDNYDSGEIEWRDENHGVVDGSGDQEEDTELPYDLIRDEETWIQDVNLLLDAGYTTDENAAKDLDREIYLDYDYIFEEYNIKYYNQGIIAKIPKNRLRFMPVTKKPVNSTIATTVEYNKTPCGEDDASNIWLLDTDSTLTFNFSNKVCPSNVKILGILGVASCKEPGTEKTSFYELNKPGLTITSEFGEIAYTVPELASSYIANSKVEQLYSIEIDFELDPRAMTTKITDWVNITFKNEAGFYSKIISVNFEEAKYKKTKETIYVWERKYQRSVSDSLGDFNLNGPEQAIAPKIAFESGGLYFPEWTQRDRNIEAQDKLRGYYASVYYNDHVELDWGNGLDKEIDHQMVLYEEATNLDSLGDTRSYAAFLPPEIEERLSSARVDFRSSGLVITSEKLTWPRHYLHLEYERILNPWQPEGHIFSWSPNISWYHCYELGPKFAIYEPQFVHKHLPGFTEQTATPFEAYMGTVRNGYTQGKAASNAAFNASGYSAQGGDSYIGETA